MVRNLRKASTFKYRYVHRPDALVAEVAEAQGQRWSDDALLERLGKSWLLRADEMPTEQWADIFVTRHQEIREAIVAPDKARFAEMMRNPVTCDLMYGFDSLTRSLRRSRRIEDAHAPALALDGLLALSEALGASRIESPEWYTWRPRKVRVETVLPAVERALGFSIPFPNPYPAERGLATSAGVMSYRVPHAIYQAWRLRELTRGIDNPRVLEIGGGLGRAAYYARLFGITDYTIVDIPVTALAQGYYLGTCLGENEVTLPGEEPRSPTAVRLMSPGTFFAGSERYDIVLNADSLTEVGRPVATSYFRAVKERAGCLLSINHESNDYTVRDLIEEHGCSGMRMPNWLRRGYAEEVVRF